MVELYIMENNQIVSDMAARVRQTIDKLPVLVGAEAVKFSLNAFKQQGWTSNGFVAWRPRKKRNKKNVGRAILINTGRLRRSVRVTNITTQTVTIGSDVPYAKIQNEGGAINQAARSEMFIRNRHTKGKKGKMFGGMGAFKKGTTAGQGQSYHARSIIIPKRQFMGNSPEQTQLIKKLVTMQVMNAMKGIK